MFGTVWKECLKQYRSRNVFFFFVSGNWSQADGQTIYMLARARLDKVRCGVLAYRTRPCAASPTFTSNVLLEPRNVRYVRGIRHDCLKQFRLCVALVWFLCNLVRQIVISSRTFLNPFLYQGIQRNTNSKIFCMLIPYSIEQGA